MHIVFRHFLHRFMMGCSQVFAQHKVDFIDPKDFDAELICFWSLNEPEIYIIRLICVLCVCVVLDVCTTFSDFNSTDDWIAIVVLIFIVINQCAFFTFHPISPHLSPSLSFSSTGYSCTVQLNMESHRQIIANNMVLSVCLSSHTSHQMLFNTQYANIIWGFFRRKEWRRVDT